MRGDARNGKLICDYKDEKNNALLNKMNPPVVHYVSKPKPWQKDCVHPLYNLYYQYARYTNNYADIKSQSYIFRLPSILKYRIMEVLSFVKQKIHHTDKSRL